MRTSRLFNRRPARRPKQPRQALRSVLDDLVLLCECADGSCDC